MSRRGFSVFVDTLCEGAVPSIRGEDDRPMVFDTRLEAQREIVEFIQDRLQQFMDGEREFEEAIGCDEYVVEVDVLDDGSVLPVDQPERNIMIIVTETKPPLV